MCLYPGIKEVLGGPSSDAVTKLAQGKAVPLARIPARLPQSVSLTVAGANEATEVRRVMEGSFTPQICFVSGIVFKLSVSGKWVVFHLQVPLTVPCCNWNWPGGWWKVISRLLCLQTQVWRLERTLQVSLRSQSGDGSDLSRTFQDCWFVTTLVTTCRTHLYPLHLPITTKNFSCKQEPPSFPHSCALRQVPNRHRSFKCIFKGMWIPSVTANFHNCPWFQHHLKALRRLITKLKNQIYSSETKENPLEKLC